MKFLVPNYSCLKNPWLGGYRSQIPVLSVLNWICLTPPPEKKFLRTPLVAKLKKIQIFVDIRIFYTELLDPEDEGTVRLVNIGKYLVNKISLTL